MEAVPARTPTYRSWRDAPVALVFWAFVSWMLFTASFSLLFSTSLAVMSLGGSCASGGPYEIEVECPADVAVFAPLSIFGGLIAVGVSLAIVRGFAAPLVAWAWPVLFVGLSIPFFLSGADGSVTGIVIGVFFALMGAAPLFALLSRPAYLFVGSRDVRGRDFSPASAPRWARAGRAETGRRPGTGDWMLSLAVTATAAAAGLLLARVLWLSVA